MAHLKVVAKGGETPAADDRLKVVEPISTEGKVKVTVIIGGAKREFFVIEESRFSELVKDVGGDLNLFGNEIIKVDDILMDYDYRLKEGDEIVVMLAEVTYGPNTRDVSEYVGRCLSNCLERCRQALNIPADSNIEAEVNGKKVALDHIIGVGDRIELSKQKGRKL
ncbi:hypothetical protein HGA64_04035 [Candidatus Falkowbacteria bacterium]|nr:hypothetical protein [Candidatus Falkowbacteria bacterium]